MNPIFRRKLSFILNNRSISHELSCFKPYHDARTPFYDPMVYGICRARLYSSECAFSRYALLRNSSILGTSNVCLVNSVSGYWECSLTRSTQLRESSFSRCPPTKNTQLRESSSLDTGFGNLVNGVSSYSEFSLTRNTQLRESSCSGTDRVYVVNSLGSHYQNSLARSTQLRDFPRFGFSRSFSSQPKKFPEYEMPSVTWGVVQGRKERLVSKVIICDYLKGLGIITDELEDIELPSTVDVMRERVEFLQKIGLTIDDINEYPLMLGCSVRKNIIPVLGYLEKIGIPRSKLGEFVKSYPQVLHASVVVELVPVVRFLRGLDVEREDIGYVLQKYPELLGFKLEGTMSTSVAYLVSIGVNPRDIGPMVTQYPYILGMRVGTVIKPLVDYLVSLGLPKKILARMFEKRPYVFGYDLEGTVKPNVECLVSFGIKRETLPSIIAQYPQILGLPLKAKLSSQQYLFSLKLKIDPESFAGIVERMPPLVSLNQNVIMKPVEFLLGRGISVEDVAKMVVRCPQLVASHIVLMKNSFYFFKSEMGRPIRELVEFPEYFTYSLESRIKPRYQKLQSKGVRCSLAWFLNCSDQRFEERLRGGCIETENGGPTFYMGGKLELPGRNLATDEEYESEDEVLYRRTVSL